jgi:hypothetical protein
MNKVIQSKLISNDQSSDCLFVLVIFFFKLCVDKYDLQQTIKLINNAQAGKKNPFTICLLQPIIIFLINYFDT